MGRKDLSQERIKMILDAFEECIIEFGLFGTTLTMVAKKANVNRGQIHKYIGDRNALLTALVERFMRRDLNIFNTLHYSSKKSLDFDQIIDFIFNELGRDASDKKDIIFNSVVAESFHNEYLHKIIQEVNTTMVNELVKTINSIFPHAPMKRCKDVAYLIWSMATGSALMLFMGFESSHQSEMKSVARSLMQSLEDSTAEKFHTQGENHAKGNGN
jgi:AcrR family transcriptional regulator